MVSGTAGSVYTYFNLPPPSDASIIATIKAWQDVTEATADLGDPRDEITAQMVSASLKILDLAAYVSRSELYTRNILATRTISARN